MRVFVACLMALGLIVTPAIARNGAGADKAGATAAETTAAPADPKAADSPAAAAKADSPATPAEAELASELRELRDLIESQQKQIQSQNDQLQKEQQQMQTLQNALISSGAAAANSTGSSSINASMASTPAVIAGPVTPNGALSPNAPAKAANQAAAADEPPALRFKGITLTPGGYFAAETVWRNRAIGSGINSSFSGVPLPGNEQSHITEFNASGRQSRIAMLAQGKLKGVTIGGYYEGDFLGTGITSNDNQSNSYVFRQRQFWAQAKFDSGLTVTGGQMWSLVTETKNGADNRTEATTQTIDAQYNVGFSWARQYGLRVSKSFGNQLWLAASVEGAQTTLAVPHCVTGTTGTTCTPTNNFLLGSFGVGGGLFNATANYAYETAPDFVVKAVFQPKGRGHYEIFGLLTTLRDRVYPCATVAATGSCGGAVGNAAAGAFNDTRNGGGIGANARARFFKHLDLGVHFFGGDGIGRYGSVGLSQVTVRPNGTLAPIRNYQSLGTIEYFSNKLDIYAYVGDEYEARAAYTVGTGATAVTTGYGSPLFSNKGCWSEALPGASTSTATGVGGQMGFVPGGFTGTCTNDTKSQIEGTLGFWYRFYRGPKGTLQFGMQESYFVRYDWNGLGNASGVGVTGAPHGTDNMVFSSFRYVLP